MRLCSHLFRNGDSSAGGRRGTGSTRQSENTHLCGARSIRRNDVASDDYDLAFLPSSVSIILAGYLTLSGTSAGLSLIDIGTEPQGQPLFTQSRTNASLSTLVRDSEDQPTLTGFGRYWCSLLTAGFYARLMARWA